MKERPILFSAPMVRALLAGTKTQTRRVVDMDRVNEVFAAQCTAEHDVILCGIDRFTEEQAEQERRQRVLTYERNKVGLWAKFAGLAKPDSFARDVGLPSVLCPYGQPGDRLYVREAWRTTGDGGRCDCMPPRDLQPHAVWYEADGIAPADECVGKSRRAFHMPRWASRITLEITSVRVERLFSLTAADAWAEGIPHSPDVNPLHEFEELWSSINGADSWQANPWVWVVEFERVRRTP